MMTESESREILDAEHLRLLSMAYWILGGIGALFSFFPLIYVVV
jgi:hypothetical protein